MCKKEYDAYEAGYNDGHFDGVWLTYALDCRCLACLHAYERGFFDGVDDLFALAADRPAPPAPRPAHTPPPPAPHPSKE